MRSNTDRLSLELLGPVKVVRLDRSGQTGEPLLKGEMLHNVAMMKNINCYLCASLGSPHRAVALYEGDLDLPLPVSSLGAEVHRHAAVVSLVAAGLKVH